MTVKNLTITLEQGLNKTCLLCLFSALHKVFKASANEFIRTIFEGFSASSLRFFENSLGLFQIALSKCDNKANKIKNLKKMKTKQQTNELIRSHEREMLERGQEVRG